MDITDFKVKTSIKVAWGDMDAFRHVNNIEYVRWGQVARIDYFQATGFDINAPELQMYAPILGFQSVKYIAPVFYPDTVDIGTRVEEIKEDRLVMKSYFYSQTQGRLVAIKTHEIIFFDYKTQQKVLVPALVVERVRAIEG